MKPNSKCVLYQLHTHCAYIYIEIASINICTSTTYALLQTGYEVVGVVVVVVGKYRDEFVTNYDFDR